MLSQIDGKLEEHARRTRVVHLTSGHTMPDIRVFEKECRTLADEGYDVTVVARHPKNEILRGVRIVAVHNSPNLGRLERLTKVVWAVYRNAARQKADICHFHDPELLLAGLLLKLSGCKVIFDAHEAFARKLLSKRWIPSLLRPLFAAGYSLLERYVCRRFDYVIAADRTAADNVRGRVAVLANYPIPAQLQTRRVSTEANTTPYVLIYAGGLEPDRGMEVMLDIADLLGPLIELRLFGWWHDALCERRANSMPNVKYLGFRPVSLLYEEMAKADLGLMLLQPVSAYLYANENTNKLFEYMLCAVPVVASDFHAFRTLIEGTRCGVCVDATNARLIAEEILRLLRNPQLREQMGANGRSAVLRNYNWNIEKQKLLAVYEELTGGPLSAMRDVSMTRN